jgi:hypothetical protein
MRIQQEASGFELTIESDLLGRLLAASVSPASIYNTEELIWALRDEMTDDEIMDELNQDAVLEYVVNRFDARELVGRLGCGWVELLRAAEPAELLAALAERLSTPWTRIAVAAHKEMNND